MNDYYVYLHRRASDKSIFYVGKGREYRAWSMSGRNRLWREVFAIDGRVVEIVSKDMSERDALAMEARLILRYKDEGHRLVNASRKAWLDVRADIEYCWEHKTWLMVRATAMEMMEHYGGTVLGWSKILNEVNPSYRGWKPIAGSPYLCCCEVGTKIPKTKSEIEQIAAYQKRFL